MSQVTTKMSNEHHIDGITKVLGFHLQSKQMEQRCEENILIQVQYKGYQRGPEIAMNNLASPKS